MAHLLVVDDETSARTTLALLLRKRGHRVVEADSVTAAAKSLTEEVFDLVVTDLRMPDGDGLDVLRTAKAQAPTTEVILLTAYAEWKSAKEAIRLGALDYFEKGQEPDELYHRIDKALAGRALRRENENLRAQLRERYRCPIGLSDHSATTHAGIAAAALGANLLEIHLTFSRESFGPDTSSSLTIDELARLVEGVRFVETALAHPVDKDLAAAGTTELRKMFGKSIVAARAITADVSAGKLRSPAAILSLSQRIGSLPATREITALLDGSPHRMRFAPAMSSSVTAVSSFTRASPRNWRRQCWIACSSSASAQMATALCRDWPVGRTKCTGSRS